MYEVGFLKISTPIQITRSRLCQPIRNPYSPRLLFLRRRHRCGRKRGQLDKYSIDSTCRYIKCSTCGMIAEIRRRIINTVPAITSYLCENLVAQGLAGHITFVVGFIEIDHRAPNILQVCLVSGITNGRSWPRIRNSGTCRCISRCNFIGKALHLSGQPGIERWAFAIYIYAQPCVQR